MKYLVKTGNWELNVSCKDIMEAATKAVEKIFTKKGTHTFGAVTMVWDEESIKNNKKENQFYIYTPIVLANAGKYQEAEQMKKNIDQVMENL